MNNIREKEKTINDVIVDTFERDIRHIGRNFEVEAGTTGFNGDGKAYFRVTAKNAQFFSRVHYNREGHPFSVEMAVSGDAEVLALMEALDFALTAICEQSLE